MRNCIRFVHCFIPKAQKSTCPWEELHTFIERTNERTNARLRMNASPLLHAQTYAPTCNVPTDANDGLLSKPVRKCAGLILHDHLIKDVFMQRQTPGPC